MGWATYISFMVLAIYHSKENRPAERNGSAKLADFLAELKDVAVDVTDGEFALAIVEVFPWDRR